MKTTRLDLPVMASWMESNGRRLDCNPYLSGGFEARVLLDRLNAVKQPLKEVTQGGMKGIFNGPRFSRHYVNDPKHGVPFLGSTDILAADLSGLSMISKKQVKAHPELLIDEGWTLITCSGTIGRMVFSRADMKGMTGSQHFMRIVADRTKIPPGYLYAYLSSRFGVSLIISGTYGSIIQHLEPNHIEDLPVPRLGDSIESQVHELVHKAASNRVEASNLFEESVQDIIDHFQLEQPREYQEYPHPSINIANSSQVRQRMDAYYYADWNNNAEEQFNSVPKDRQACLGDVTEDLYIPGIFKRVYVDSRVYGYPYITGTDVFSLSPTSNRFLSKKVAEDFRLVLKKGMILVQDSGQLGGLIGRPVPVGRYLDGFACTNNLVRITPKSETDQGYIFAVLNTTYGIRLVVREATGSSIPHLDEKRVKRIQIPWADDETRILIGAKVLKAIEMRDEACDLESEARSIVEFEIAGST